jgi:hypothetical protein
LLIDRQLHYLGYLLRGVAFLGRVRDGALRDDQ